MTKKIDVTDLGIDPDEMEEMLEKMTAPESKQGRKLPRAKRYIGAPLAFIHEVCLLTEGRSALAVAFCIYRRVCIDRNRTVTLPSAELGPLGVDRPRKREALTRLQNAGLIEVKNATGRTAQVTLLWQSS